jgi:hypothetical protein
MGLYQDDSAADLKSSIALLAALPASGERLLEILLESHREGVSFDDDGGPTFWLVVADQFERRGIACPKAFEQALAAIETGADLRDLEARGAGPGDLRKRAKILTELAERLRSPRPPRPRPKGTKPPPFVVEVGEVYRFPTSRGQSINPWYPSVKTPEFKPDGWGALLVVSRGRVFDWFPWCAAGSVTVAPERPPSLDDVLQAHLISNQEGATYCVPRRTHLKRMHMELLGRLSLDPARASAVISDEATPQFAVMAGWSFIAQARGWRGSSQDGVPVRELLAST